MIPQKTLIKKKIHQTEYELEKKRLTGGNLGLFARPDEGPTSIAVLAAFRVTGTIVGLVFILMLFFLNSSAVVSSEETVLALFIFLGIQIVPFMVGYGLWNLKTWAWKLYIIDIAANMALVVLIMLLSAGNSTELSGLIINTIFSEIGPFFIFFIIIYNNREYFVH